jgi:hypothetical protein
VALALLAVVLVAIGTVALLAGDDLNRPAESEPVPSATGTPVDVVLLGDSITEANEAALRAAIGPGHEVRVAAHSGFKVEGLLDDARALAADQPERLVVNLGTNDVFYAWPLEASMAAYEELLDLFPAADCVRLVTVNEDMYDRVDAALVGRAVRFNQALADLASSRGAELVAWHDVVRRDIEAGHPDGPIAFDTVHPTGPGVVLLADLYRDAVSSCR